MKNNDIINHLKKTGFSDKSALIYTTLLEMGGAYPSSLAEATKLNRSTVYKILLELSVKGLVTEIEKGKKLYYQIEKPEKLVKHARMHAEMAEDAYQKTRDLIPEIEGLYSLTPNKPKIRFFENREGAMSILDDHINTKKGYEMLGFANTVGLEKFIPQKYFQNYVKQKERLGITSRGISPNLEDATTFNNRIYKNISKKIWPVFRFIPKDQFPFNGEIIIYGTNKVSIFNIDEHDKIVGIIIEDEAIHRMMKTIFELAWKGALA
jgi:sugar-specific transcriptional regulator TrmB